MPGLPYLAFKNKNNPKTRGYTQTQSKLNIGYVYVDCVTWPPCLLCTYTWLNTSVGSLPRHEKWLCVSQKLVISNIGGQHGIHCCVVNNTKALTLYWMDSSSYWTWLKIKVALFSVQGEIKISKSKIKKRMQFGKTKEKPINGYLFEKALQFIAYLLRIWCYIGVFLMQLLFLKPFAVK